MTPSQRAILAIDPGRDKCGLALVDLAGQALSLQVVARCDLPAAVQDALRRADVQHILVGDATGGRDVRQQLTALLPAVPILSAPERNTTLRAREVYFRDAPPRGWRRLVPHGLLLPPRPVDDYAALLIARDWLTAAPSDPS